LIILVLLAWIEGKRLDIGALFASGVLKVVVAGLILLLIFIAGFVLNEDTPI
jgi:hypothetical protein